MSNHIDVASVKQAARNRWPEILSRLGGIPQDILDGKHHPCPKCGGTDRFRLIDAQDGACLCNRCFDQGNGDGIAALGWLCGWEFKRTIAEVSRFLGIQPSTNGHQKHAPTQSKGAGSLRDAVRWLADALLDTLLPAWCKAKLPITPDAAKAFHARACCWPKSGAGYRCIAFSGRSIDGQKLDVAALLLHRVEGQPFPPVRSLTERKTHLVKGSRESWIWPGTLDELRAANVIVKCEGPSDALALHSAGLPAGWLVITNACGAKSTARLDFSFATGKKVVVVGDADRPGVDGARRFAVQFHKAGAAEVRNVSLPYAVSEDHGQDLRDWLQEGHIAEEFVALVEATPPVSGEEIAQWQAESKAKDKPRITNAAWVDTPDGVQIAPLPMDEVIATIFAATGQWPKRVGSSLFAQEGEAILWLDKTPALFGWLGHNCGVVQWAGAQGCVTKDECLCRLRQVAEEFASVEALPHYPPIPGRYYARQVVTPGDGSTVAQFLAFFCPETAEDRQLSLAALLTPIWGGQPGTRPGFMWTAKGGRGRGKTRAAQFTARVHGGYIDVSPNEDIGGIKTRLLTAEAAAYRVALLDNVKTTRFSWGELESLITSAVVSGKKLYIGNGTRPNDLTWFVTLNGASLSTDLAQRIVEIRLRDPVFDAGWDERVAQFIDTHQLDLTADLVGILQRPAKPLPKHTRWASWDSQVLSRLDNPAGLLDLIQTRRGEVDAEEEEGDIIETFFASKLKWLDYDIERDDVFLTNEFVVRWYNQATGDTCKTTGVTKALRQSRDEGRIHHLVYDRVGSQGQRGFRWVGEHSDSAAPTRFDLRHRLEEKLSSQQAESGSKPSDTGHF